MKNFINFYLNGQLQTIKDVSPTELLIDYLRSSKINCTGTKLSCGEGGCGACSVLWSTYDPETDSIKEVATNACLRPIASLDGSAITTIEGLKTEKNIIQQQIRECSATQCGYCTPGFEMNMYSLLKHESLTAQKVEDSFGGNLCRCTGYISILKAMHNVANEPEEIKNAFLKENDWVLREHFPEKEELFIKDLTHSWYRPLALDTLLTYLKQSKAGAGALRFVKGNTSIGIYKRDIEDPTILIDISQIPEFNNIKSDDAGIYVGSGITMSFLLDYIASNFKDDDAPIHRGLKALQLHISKIAGSQVRNTGSLAGNLMLVKNHRLIGKPFPSDLFTVLATLGAEIDVLNYEGEKKRYPILMWVAEDIPKSIVSGIAIPINKPSAYIQTYKLSKRLQNAHAIVNAGFHFELDEADNIVSACMIFGGIARVAFNLEKLQDKIISAFSEINNENYGILRKLLIEELKQRITSLDLDDVSDDVRISLCANLFYKFYSYLARERKILSFTDHDSGVNPLRPLAIGLQDTLIAPYYDPEDNQVNTVFSGHKFKMKIPEILEQVKQSENTPLEHLVGRTQQAMAFARTVLEKDKVRKIDSAGQTTGRAKYTHDMHGPGDTLQAWYVISERRYAEFEYKGGHENLLMELRREFEDAHYICTKDIGEKKQEADSYQTAIKNMKKYDPVFADGIVTCYGQPIGLIAAATLDIAKKAARFVQERIVYKEMEAVITLEQAIIKGSLLSTDEDISHIARPVGEENAVRWMENPYKEKDEVFVEGGLNTGEQFHFYMEPQGALAIPGEEDELKIYSSSQHLAKCQDRLAKTLGLSHNKVSVGVSRVGGGFGGKELRQVFIATAAGIAAFILKKPVRLLLDRQLDMQMIGTRHPFYGRFWLSANAVTQKINKFKVDYKLDGGHSLDCTIPVMELALLHGENTYDIEVNKTVGQAYLTHVQSRTAFRSFGLVQSILIVEEAIEKLSYEMGIAPERLRENNFYKDGQLDMKPYPITPYGQELPHCRINQVWRDFKDKISFDERKAEVERFNRKNKFRKRGLSMIPLKYGISYTSRTSNQGSAYLFAYKGDGSVILHHGGVEMGQGLHTKMAQLAADTLGIDINMIRIAESDTTDIPNASSTGASTGSDLNGYAVVEAAKILRANLESFCRDYINNPKEYPEIKDEKIKKSISAYSTNWKNEWAKIVVGAYTCRRNLSAQYTYASPHLGTLQLKNGDNQKEPFPQIPEHSRLFYYFNYCVAASEVEVDILTGQFEIIRSDIVYDAGDTLNDTVDYGQIEGGFVQGIGYLTTEEVLYEKGGRVITDGTWTYKPPCTKTIPQIFNVYLLKYESSGIKTDAPKDMYGINSSKSTGEPPLVLSNTVYFAIKHAIMSFRKNQGKDDWVRLDPPASIEKINLAIWEGIDYVKALSNELNSEV
jgi:xanthine dehydrogenase/oxidase